MNLVADSNSEAFSESLREFIRFYGVELPKALRYQSRLLAQEFIRKTPAKTRAQGRRAVERDIQRAVRPLRPQDFKSRNIRALIRKRDYHALETVFSRFPESSDLRKVSVLSFDSKLHQQARDRRGRIQSFKRKVTPDSDAVKKYVAEIKTHVGQAKGGWANSLINLGGRPAAWISEHANAGSVEDHASSIRGYIQMTNRSDWAGSGDEDRVIEKSLRSRSVAMFNALAHAQERALHNSFAR
jgi:hypothetical protein